MKQHMALVIFAVALLLPGLAQAKLKIFEGSAGGLFVAGGNVWTKPDTPGNIILDDSIPFADTAGGYGVGGGLMFEARFIKFIGLELDVLFEHNDQWYSVEVNGGIAEAKFHLKYLNVRLPILLKAVIPTGIVRVSIGIGPEFVFSRKDRTEVEDLKNNILNIQQLRDQFHSKAQDDVYICTHLGFAFKVWKLSIPLNIRFSYNLTQPKNYEDRLGIEGLSETLTASETMDISLMLGLAYDF